MAIDIENLFAWTKSILVSLWIIITTLSLWIYYGFLALIPEKFYQKKNVSGHVTLITGAGSGIGQILAIKFAEVGAKIVVWDVNENGAKETLRKIATVAPNCNAKYYVCDVTDREEVYRTADIVREDFGDVDILINNAGIVSGKKFVDSDDQQVMKTMQVNCLAHFWTVKAFLPSMIERNFGHIVTVSSAAGIIAVNNLVDYSTSKFAAIGFHEALGLELDSMGLHNIYLTLVCPYYINTGMFQGVTSKFDLVLPIMEPEYAAGKIFGAVLMNQPMIAIPRFLYFFFVLKSLIPIQVGYHLGRGMEITKSMDDFTGREGK